MLHLIIALLVLASTSTSRYLLITHPFTYSFAHLFIDSFKKHILNIYYRLSIMRSTEYPGITSALESNCYIPAIP